MNEARVTSEFRVYLLSRLPGVWFKHADRSTMGMPDCSFTCRKITLWMEIKLLSLGREQVGISAKEIVEASSHGRLQLETMLRLSSCGNARYIVFCRRAERWWTLVIPPEKISEAYRNKDDHFYLHQEDEGKLFTKVEELFKERR